MNSDTPTYTDRIYGVHWTLAFGLPAVIFVYVLLVLGCTSPLVELERNAPLIESNITANGNTATVPLVGQ